MFKLNYRRPSFTTKARAWRGTLWFGTTSRTYMTPPGCSCAWAQIPKYRPQTPQTIAKNFQNYTNPQQLSKNSSSFFRINLQTQLGRFKHVSSCLQHLDNLDPQIFPAEYVCRVHLISLTPTKILPLRISTVLTPNLSCKPPEGFWISPDPESDQYTAVVKDQTFHVSKWIASLFRLFKSFMQSAPRKKQNDCAMCLRYSRKLLGTCLGCFLRAVLDEFERFLVLYSEVFGRFFDDKTNLQHGLRVTPIKEPVESLYNIYNSPT